MIPRMIVCQINYPQDNYPPDNQFAKIIVRMIVFRIIIQGLLFWTYYFRIFIPNDDYFQSQDPEMHYSQIIISR